MRDNWPALPYVEVDYNMPRRTKPDVSVPSWIARHTSVNIPRVGDLVAITDGEIDGGDVLIGRLTKVDPEVHFRQREGWSFPEEWIYVWVAPIHYEITDKGFIDGH